VLLSSLCLVAVCQFVLHEREYEYEYEYEYS